MKRIVIFILLIIFLIPLNTFAVTREEYNNAVSNVAISAATTHADDFVYTFYWGGSPSNPVNMSSTLSSWLQSAQKGIKISSGAIYGVRKDDAGIKGSFSNKFPVYCATFVKLMVYHASSGTTVFNYGDHNDSYEKINVNSLMKGDIIDFKSHVAIYLDNGNDSNPYTFRVVEASAKVQVRVILRDDIETGWRIKDSVLQTLDSNLINASYDFHDRLDDYPPVLSMVNEIPNTNRIKIYATDYKHYDLNNHSDLLEPESNGIVAYQVSKNSMPLMDNWKPVNKTNILDIEEEIEGNGIYYVFIKDIGGNVTKNTYNFTNIVVDNELPTVGQLSYEALETSIKINIDKATDNKGIKEYRFYLDDKLVGSSISNSYLIKNLSRNKLYNFYYEVVDTNNNVVKSKIFQIETIVDAKSIEIGDSELYLVKGENYQLSPKVEADNTNYQINYKSSNEEVARVNANGEINALTPGKTIVTISVGRTTKDVYVKVSPEAIIFDLYDLPSAYIGKEYKQEIKTNPDSTITLIDSKLPSGLIFVNNTLKGTPSDNSIGEYELKLFAKSNNSESVKKYTLFVKYNIEINNDTLSKAYLNKSYNELLDINYPATISITDGALPKGLVLQDNKIIGTPTDTGEYKFTIKADYLGSTCEREYIITVSKYSLTDYIIILVIIIVVILLIYLINSFKIKKKDSVK